MRSWPSRVNLAICAVLGVSLLVINARTETFGEAKLVYEWTSLEYDWPSASDREAAIQNGTFVPERNMLAGIKVYKNDVYLTIPRWTWTSGHPVTLAKVVDVQGQAVIRPYPDWASQRQGDCQALQYVQSMEIDPNTGLMYVIDTGRVGIGAAAPLNLCPAKIVVYDLNTDTKVESYELPADFVTRDANFLNDIVLDYIGGKVRYAYISDVGEGRLHVYDFQTRRGHNLDDPSMKAEGGNGSAIHINGQDYNVPAPLDGIAISPDFLYVYYCPLGGYNLYQVPTSTLRNGNPNDKTGLRLVGRKVSQSDGMAYGSNHLFYGALGLNAVYYWDSEKDMADQSLGMDQVTLRTQTELVKDDITMQWPDTFAFDDEGWLWFVSNRLHLFRSGGLDFSSGQDINVRVWKVYVNETGYLYQADVRTSTHVDPIVG